MYASFRYLLLVVFTYLMAISSAQGTVKIAVTDWPPYYSKNAANGGQQLALIISVFEKLNQQVEVVWYRTGVGALVKVKANLLDVAAGWECNQSRVNDFIFSDPIGYEETAIFYHKDLKFNWSNIEDLDREFTLGITARYAYGSDLKRLLDMDRPNVEVSGTDRHNINLLLNREIDLFLVDKRVGLSIIKQIKEPEAKNIKVHSIPFRKRRIALRLLVSKKNNNAQVFMNEFNAALSEVRAQKQLSELAPNQFPLCPKRKL